MLAVPALLLVLSISAIEAWGQDKADTKGAPGSDFKWEADRFADVRVLRYWIPGWEQLSLKEKTLAYHLTMAGLSGRDIMWDQNYRHNLGYCQMLVL